VAGTIPILPLSTKSARSVVRRVIWRRIAVKHHLGLVTLRIAKTIAMHMTRTNETATTKIVRVVRSRKITQTVTVTEMVDVMKNRSQGALIHIQGHMVTSMLLCPMLY
jgi:hypothetical protein